MESFGESIEVSEAYVLPDLNQSQRALPERIDVHDHPIADIEGMFHQIRVREEDQESLRFLWWTNTYEDPLDAYVVQVYIYLKQHLLLVLLNPPYDELRMTMLRTSAPVSLQL